jgi:ankyrin repeat protein
MKYLILLLVLLFSGCKGTYDTALKNEGYEPDGLGFISAVKDDNKKAVGWFLKMPKVLSFADSSGSTAVFYAAGLKEQGMLSTLIKAGLPVEIVNNSKKNPLHYAAESGCVENVKMLLEKGVDPKWEDNFEKDALNTLISFRKEENMEIFEMLVEAGVDINSKDMDRKTPLIIASEKGHEKYMKRLMELKASPLQKDFKGRIALDYATENYDRKVIGHEIFNLLSEYTNGIKGNL